MQVKDYCKAMLAEVTAWKEKLEAMKKVADSYGTEQKEKILPLVGQIERRLPMRRCAYSSSNRSARLTGRR